MRGMNFMEGLHGSVAVEPQFEVGCDPRYVRVTPYQSGGSPNANYGVPQNTQSLSNGGFFGSSDMLFPAADLDQDFFSALADFSVPGDITNFNADSSPSHDSNTEFSPFSSDAFPNSHTTATSPDFGGFIQTLFEPAQSNSVHASSANDAEAIPESESHFENAFEAPEVIERPNKNFDFRAAKGILGSLDPEFVSGLVGGIDNFIGSNHHEGIFGTKAATDDNIHHNTANITSQGDQDLNTARDIQEPTSEPIETDQSVNSGNGNQEDFRQLAEGNGNYRDQSNPVSEAAAGCNDQVVLEEERSATFPLEPIGPYGSAVDDLDLSQIAEYAPNANLPQIGDAFDLFGSPLSEEHVLNTSEPLSQGNVTNPSEDGDLDADGDFDDDFTGQMTEQHTSSQLQHSQAQTPDRRVGSQFQVGDTSNATENIQGANAAHVTDFACTRNGQNNSNAYPSNTTHGYSGYGGNHDKETQTGSSIFQGPDPQYYVPEAFRVADLERKKQNLNFATKEMAKEAWSSNKVPQPPFDPSFPKDKSQEKMWAAIIVNAMKDQSIAQESENTLKTFHNNVNERYPTLEHVAWKVLANAMEYWSMDGPLQPRAPYGQKIKRFESFGEHMGALLNVLKVSKTVCNRLMQGNYLLGFIDAPHLTTGRVYSNKSVNAGKKKQKEDAENRNAELIKHLEDNNMPVPEHLRNPSKKRGRGRKEATTEAETDSTPAQQIQSVPANTSQKRPAEDSEAPENPKRQKVSAGTSEEVTPIAAGQPGSAENPHVIGSQLTPPIIFNTTAYDVRNTNTNHAGTHRPTGSYQQTGAYVHPYAGQTVYANHDGVHGRIAANPNTNAHGGQNPYTQQMGHQIQAGATTRTRVGQYPNMNHHVQAGATPRAYGGQNPNMNQIQAGAAARTHGGQKPNKNQRRVSNPLISQLRENQAGQHMTGFNNQHHPGHMNPIRADDQLSIGDLQDVQNAQLGHGRARSVSRSSVGSGNRPQSGADNVQNNNRGNAFGAHVVQPTMTASQLQATPNRTHPINYAQSIATPAPQPSTQPSQAPQRGNNPKNWSSFKTACFKNNLTGGATIVPLAKPNKGQPTPEERAENTRKKQQALAESRERMRKKKAEFKRAAKAAKRNGANPPTSSTQVIHAENEYAEVGNRQLTDEELWEEYMNAPGPDPSISS